MILLTGGAGYIGSHMLLKLLQSNHQVVVLDNLSNSNRESIKRVEALSKRQCVFIEGDIRDRHCLNGIFDQYAINAVLHFAGLKAVGESVSEPVLYFDNNINGSLQLLQSMQQFNIKKIVFSSSATVYGDPDKLPIAEDCPMSMPTNPYGYTKMAVEQMLMQLVQSDPTWSVAALRYFNPVGAHESGMIGEDPNGIPNNLLPYIAQVAIGKRNKLSIYGSDYDTHDGTGVRDYIHVMDLVEGHLSALNYISGHQGYHVWNLGAGSGHSVLDMVKAFEKVSNTKVPYQIVDKRDGDIASCYADATKAHQQLNWSTQRSVEDMMQDTWRWQTQNPNGYNY
ncbi:UDP-glucose 4-epimerase GalE [Psychrobacter sp. 1Y11]|uniref:UDP-glucose 4-epimerase GalE n=1 Tax=Psychrobacter sp. 1Y11 TaxID=3457446 RepID=UPI003FCF85CD